MRRPAACHVACQALRAALDSSVSAPHCCCRVLTESALQELLLAMNWDVYGLLRRAGYRASDVPASAA